MKLIKHITGALLACCIFMTLLSGCGRDTSSVSAPDSTKKSFVFGDTTFNAENEEPNVNPHCAYAGWACIRYGIGETLFRYSDNMDIEPWLAEGYDIVDDLTWRLTLRDNVYFTSGRKMDGCAVKECIDHLIDVHDRARGDLMIESVTAEGQSVTIKTREPRPALLNYLSDPYGCIIDMEAGITDEGNVSATGPYRAVTVVTDERLELVKNENYWNGTPKLDEIIVRTISDGDTLTMALQSGEIDAAYGMPYASYPIFENDNYIFSGAPTSRTFFCHMNFESPISSDPAVRRAIAMGIDKKSFVNTLLDGNGYVAAGAYPDTFSFGDVAVTPEAYNPEGAKKVLEDAGWKDTDGDGIREKDGLGLNVRWLTYPSRQELPLLAESARASLEEIGINVLINVTPDNNTLRLNPSAWDVYASAMVTAPTGDPQYFFTTHCLDASTQNNGHYHSEKLETLAAELATAFDASRREELAIQMQQTILDDNAFVFCSHLRMNIISRKGVTGLTAHPCDFYEITAELDVE